jgi:hypothetical protein
MEPTVKAGTVLSIGTVISINTDVTMKLGGSTFNVSFKNVEKAVESA